MWMIEGVGDTAGMMDAVFPNVDTALAYADAAGIARERLSALTLPRALAALEAAAAAYERDALAREREDERARLAEADREASETRSMLNSSDEMLDRERERLKSARAEVDAQRELAAALERELAAMKQRVAFAVSTLNAALDGQTLELRDLDHA